MELLRQTGTGSFYARYLSLILLSLLAAGLSVGRAQTLSSQEMENRFELSRLHYEIGKMDSAALDFELYFAPQNKAALRGLFKGTRFDLYRLAAKTFVALDRFPDAAFALKKMFALRPEYEIDEDDPIAFKYAADTLRAIGKWTVGMYGGLNLADVRVGKQNEHAFEWKKDAGFAPIFSKKYTNKTSFFIGAQFNYRLGKYWNLGFSPRFSSYKYTVQAIRRPESGFFFDYYFEQELNYLEIPLSLSFEWVGQSKWTPYLSIGGSYSRLSNAGKLIGYADYDQNLIGSPIFFNDRDLFQTGEWGYIVGTGVLYSLKYLDLRAGMDFISGISNLRDGNNANLKLYFEYAHSPDDLNLDRLYFHIGFVYDINFKTYEFSRK